MILDIITYICIGIGCFFNLVAAIGLHRFHDPYMRMHASTKCTTFGGIFLIGAVVLQSARIWVSEGSASAQSIMIIHSVIALIVAMLTSATSSHAIAQAAHRSGIKPARAVVDDLEEDVRNKEKQ